MPLHVQISLLISLCKAFSPLKDIEEFSNIIALKFGYVVIDAYLCT